MGALMRSLDWAATPIGPVAEWPATLRAAVGICLSSRFPMLIWWGPELVKLYNDPYRPMLGNKHPASMGRAGREVWPEIWDVIGPMLDAVTERGEATWSEDQLLMMDRSGYLEEAYFTFSYSPIRDESGSVAGIFTAVQETTERVLGTRRLEALSRLSGIADEGRSAQQVADRAAAALAGAVDVPFALLYLLEGNGARLAAATGLAAGDPLAPARLTGGPWRLDGAVRVVGGLRAHADGGVEVASAITLPLAPHGERDPAGLLVLGVNPHRALDSAYRDFLRLAAQQVATGLASARHLAAERARADALTQLDRAKTEFFSNVSHEFRTPLTLMLGPLGDALAEPDAPAAVRRERIELAHRSALRMLKLVNALLDFSRLEAGRATVTFAPVDVARLASDMAAVFRSAIEAGRLELVVDAPRAGQSIDADAEMLEKILLNLLSNAFKFTLAGRIELRVRIGRTAVVEVADTGVGIAEEDLPHVFERFHRVAEARGRSHEGTGIGLALVHELVELHGGSVGVRSIPGEGTTFTVELPLRQAGAATEPVERDPSMDALRAGFLEEALRWEPGEPVADGRAERGDADVLVVDDNADLRAYLARVLSERYAVRTAADGREALERLHERAADLVLTDVMMPRMDGFELLRALRADERTRRVPVIMLSARAGADAAVEGLEAGADDYLVKPFSVTELVARVRANLEITRLRDALAAGELRHAHAMEDVALTLQRSLLPQAMPELPGLELAFRYVPAGRALEVGGDFYDAVVLLDGRVALSIGDVAGHGVLAAAVMGQVRQALRAYVLEDHEPAELMARLDRLVADGGLAMTTCLCALLDPVEGTMRYSNAGHPPPLLRRADGSVERLTGALSHPLGVTESPGHVQAEVELREGEALLLYTDGLVERRGESIDAGIDRLAAIVARERDGAGALCEAVESGLGIREPDDDVVVLAVRRTSLRLPELQIRLLAHPSRLVGMRRRLSGWLAAHEAPRDDALDIVLACHEACMNAVEHAYGPGDAEVTVVARIGDGEVTIEVRDRGRWREPRDALRGRGQAIMSTAMDAVAIDTGAHGTTVRMRRRLGRERG